MFYDQNVNVGSDQSDRSKLTLWVPGLSPSLTGSCVSVRHVSGSSVGPGPDYGEGKVGGLVGWSCPRT